MPTLRLNSLVIASILAMSGCAKQPEGPFIVLHKRPPQIVKPTSPAKTTPIAPAQDEHVPLSPSDKEELFRKFETYLNQTVPQQ